MHSGSAALLLSDGQVRQTAGAPGDAFFRLDVHYITEAGTPSIGLAWLDEAGVQITMRTLALASAGPGYTPFTIAGVSPSRARAVEVMFLAPPGAILHVDDVSLDMGESVPIDDPAPPPTSQPDEAESAAPGPEPPSER
ncbi:MAG TPA: hypothetical protein VNL92_05355, partial [Dehalococcoidia bacterium]|nr:hypothetical protein [Dehalococcoidia bacterium]